MLTKKEKIEIARRYWRGSGGRFEHTPKKKKKSVREPLLLVDMVERLLKVHARRAHPIVQPAVAAAKHHVLVAHHARLALYRVGSHLRPKAKVGVFVDLRLQILNAEHLAHAFLDDRFQVWEPVQVHVDVPHFVRDRRLDFLDDQAIENENLLRIRPVISGAMRHALVRLRRVLIDLVLLHQAHRERLRNHQARRFLEVIHDLISQISGLLIVDIDALLTVLAQRWLVSCGKLTDHSRA
mmetsp:Transcript_6870/g.18399  ORF Transcript_6870/g.18399 Transcript_6870/m.18399 type:complete len:239 (+) Transcript_6870:88-804(+)